MTNSRIITGHYFELERGEWVKDGDNPPRFYPGSGLAYIGSLTKEQREELDRRISAYIDELRKAGHSV